MIKCNVTVCGTISREAQMRTGKEGKPFMSLGINVVIPAKSGINTFSAGSEDSIKGDIEFRGTLGNKIEEKKDKKGNPFCVFSAFSSEKNGDSYDYTWIRFLQFGEGRKEWMQPKSGINAKGELQMSVYNDRLDIACRVSEVSQWDKTANNPNR